MAYISGKNNVFECGGQRFVFKYGGQPFAFERGGQRSVLVAAWRIFGKAGQ